MDTHIVTGINAHKPGYIDESMKDLEKIVGLHGPARNDSSPSYGV